MRILLDECVDWRLLREIPGHEVKTTRQVGWTAMRNGELLALAATQFDVFLTVDRNLSFQQNIPVLGVAVVILQARTNRLADLKPLVPRLLQAIASVQPGDVRLVGG